MAALLAESLRLGGLRRFFQLPHFPFRGLYAPYLAAGSGGTVGAFIPLCAAVREGDRRLPALQYPADSPPTAGGSPAGLRKSSLYLPALCGP